MGHGRICYVLVCGYREEYFGNISINLSILTSETSGY